MKVNIIIGAFLIAALVGLWSWNKSLRFSNDYLSEYVAGLESDILEIENRNIVLEAALDMREEEISALNKKNEVFKNELSKAKVNKEFKRWFDSQLPLNVGELLKQD